LNELYQYFETFSFLVTAGMCSADGWRVGDVKETSLDTADEVSASVAWRLLREARDSQLEAAASSGTSVLLLLLLDTVPRLRASAVVEEERVGVWLVKQVELDALLSEEEEEEWLLGLVPGGSLESADPLFSDATMAPGQRKDKLLWAEVKSDLHSSIGAEHPLGLAVTVRELLKIMGTGELLETADTAGLLEAVGTGELLEIVGPGELLEMAGTGELLERVGTGELLEMVGTGEL